ncbi:MAG: methyltransferase domain-containing protein [Tissierellia bacterium]|nr:methyltransferase domain-containing protein [Tissierellia bacterium]
MICKICSKSLRTDDYIEHLKIQHPEEYKSFIEQIIALNNLEETISDIVSYLNITQEITSNDLSILKEENPDYLVKPLSIKTWKPKDFKLETTTIWSFKQRGSWATHNGKYRGNWSPYIPRNLILRYSQENDIVLDPFLGSGTTLIETKLLKRHGIGVDINPNAIRISKHNLKFNLNNEYEPKIYNSDARNLDFLKDNSIDLICAHPPYANIIQYSEDIEGDLSLLDIDEFLEEIYKVAIELYRVLKPNKYCAVLIGDTRKNKHIVPLGFRVMEVFLKAGFVLKENIIKEQHNCLTTGFWYQKSIKYNFLLISHEYLFVFRKP